MAERVKELALHRMPLGEGAVLETGCVYIVPLQESLKLPKGVAAAANPKSSTGRLDIFTRVITDYAQEFDKVPAGYKEQFWSKAPRTLHERKREEHQRPLPASVVPAPDGVRRPMPMHGLARQGTFALSRLDCQIATILIKRRGLTLLSLPLRRRGIRAPSGSRFTIGTIDILPCIGTETKGSCT